MSDEEKADLASKRQFRDDDQYRELAKRELLDPKGMSIEEKADLASKRQFRFDDHYRELAKKEILNPKGMSPQERADLTSKRSMVNSPNMQSISEYLIKALKNRSLVCTDIKR